MGKLVLWFVLVVIFIVLLVIEVKGINIVSEYKIVECFIIKVENIVIFFREWVYKIDGY